MRRTNRTAKRLNLSVETLRLLAGRELAGVAGAAARGTSLDSKCPSCAFTCASLCASKCESDCPGNCPSEIPSDCRFTCAR
jgi:hypothetical protein